MKARLQKIMLIVWFLGLAPWGLLAALLIIAATACADWGASVFGYIFTVLWMLIGVGLPVAALLLIRRLNEGYDVRLRRLLLGFYFLVFVYCGIWAGSGVRRDETDFSLFSVWEFTALCVVLLVPVLATLFMPAEEVSTGPAPR